MKTKLQLLRWLIMLVLSVSTLGVIAQPYPNPGNHVVCLNSTEPYGVEPTALSTYVWTLTTLAGGNGTVIDGLTDNLISVNWTSIGTARLQLVETNSTGCSVTVTIDVTVDPAATVNAGIDQVVCATTPTVTLAGIIGGGATSATWSGGTGAFIPNATSLTASYTPSAAEITAGTVTLTLTTNDPAGPCGAVNDQMTITINPEATVIAGIDQVVCATSPTVILTGFIGGAASSVTWTGGTGIFVPDATSLTTSYTPSAAEITTGAVTLTLTTDDPAGLCGAVNDQMTITIDPEATVSAGADQIACATSPAVTLAGTIGGSATSATWSGGSGTFAPNATTLTASYTPSAAEITAGTVTLTLTSNDPAGLCGAVNDQMTITINPAATVNAGPDQVACSTSPTFTLAGIMGGSSASATWTGGTGTFAPNATTLAASYTASPAEITAGTVTLTLTTNDPTGPCGAVADQLTITINPIPLTSTIWHN